MAIEAAHLTLFPPQLLLNNQMMMMIDAIDKQSNGNIYNANLEYYGMAHLISGTTTAETLLPMYSSAFTESINPDSCLTYCLPVSRKRSRDFSSMCPFSDAPNINKNPIDICDQIQQQQLEIDQFVARHTEKLRLDIEDRRRRNSKKLLAALEERITHSLREKEEEILQMAKLNWALEEKVKSLCIENQIWRDLALTNEVTANALRSNLKQVMEQVVHDDYRHHSTTVAENDTAALADDAQSCCESNNEKKRTLAEQDSDNSNMKRLCKSCWKAESCVLLLPCRHLCLCTVCVSCIDICPVCKSTKNISVRVHIS